MLFTQMASLSVYAQGTSCLLLLQVLLLSLSILKQHTGPVSGQRDPHKYPLR